MIRLLVVALLMLSGCGSSPPTRFFTLEPIGPASGAPAPGGDPPHLAIGKVSLPPVLDRRTIVRRAGANQLDIDGTARWAAPLDEMTQSVLARDLSLRRRNVIAENDPAPRSRPMTLRATLDVFSGDAAGTVVLDGEWSLQSPSGTEIMRRHEHVEIAGGTPAPASEAEGMSRALAGFADRIAAAASSAK